MNYQKRGQFRMHVKHLETLDEIAEAMASNPALAPTGKATRSDALRLLIERHADFTLRQLRKEAGLED